MWSYNRLIGLLLTTFLLFITPIYGQYRDGDIRLVGGSYQWEGRVEIHFSGTWGTITDSEWSNDDAQVVCRKLGHFKPGARAHSGAYFGEGSGSIHLDFVRCSGSEYNLTDCETQNSGISTSHSMDVGVKCLPASGTYREGDLRLVGGPHNWEGRVEIYWNGTWGSISDSSWSITDAKVVCSQLQHSVNGAVNRYYGEGSGTIHIQDVTCYGSERNITSCAYVNNTVRISHAQDVGVECRQGDTIKEGDIRLVGGSYLWQGRVEIFLSGVWGTISDDFASSTDARIVCRQLGYSTYRNYYCCARFGRGNGPIHIDNLACSGSEYRIRDCRYDNNTLDDSHNEDWSVYCFNDDPEFGDVRLSGGYRGRVEVFVSGIWQAVADSLMSWTLSNAEVVCKELGYDPNGTSVYPPNIYSGNTMSEHIDNVNCTGTESKLNDCHYDIISNLGFYYSVGVICQDDDCSTGDMRLVGGDNEMEGRVEVCYNNGGWGTVCDSYWTDNHTAVVCRHFGFNDTIGDSAYFSSEMFSEGTGPILMDYVNCSGSEPRLWGKCFHFTHSYGCTHSGDVGVRCQPAFCSDGQIKLIEGSEEYLGRLEICSNQRWETLPYSTFNNDEAVVACNELGYNDAVTGVYCCGQFGRGGGPIHQKVIQCTGKEQRLSQCNIYNDTMMRSHSEDVGIRCYTADCSDGAVRLLEGESEWEGRLEVCFSRRWGTVSSDGWTQTNTQVVCNDLGYDFTDKMNSSIPQSQSKPVYLHNIVCSRTDLTLLECSFTRYLGNINDVQDAVVICQQPTCSDGDLKLVGGISETEGRLEVCFGQRWGTIHGDGWTQADTQVACRHLGYSTSDVSHTKTQRTRRSSSASLPVHLTLVGCYSSEEKLVDCAHHEYTGSTSMDISISCGSTITSESAELDTVSAVSLSIAVICVCGLIVLVAVLIVVFILRRRKKYSASSQHDTELSTHRSTHTTDTGDRYSAGIGYFNQAGNKSIDNKKIDPVLDDAPMDSYEEMTVEDPVVSFPPKPQPKRPPKKPASKQAVDTTRYAHNAQQNRSKQPVMPPPVMPHARFQGQVQHPVQYLPDSPELIYEVPD